MSTRRSLPRRHSVLSGQMHRLSSSGLTHHQGLQHYSCLACPFEGISLSVRVPPAFVCRVVCARSGGSAYVPVMITSDVCQTEPASLLRTRTGTDPGKYRYLGYVILYPYSGTSKRCIRTHGCCVRGLTNRAELSGKVPEDIQNLQNFRIRYRGCTRDPCTLKRSTRTRGYCVRVHRMQRNCGYSTKGPTELTKR